MTWTEFEKWAERMRERHETLAQSVEILTHDVQELRTSVTDLKAIAEASLRNINALASIAEDQQQNIDALLRTAENHERRITRLESGE